MPSLAVVAVASPVPPRALGLAPALALVHDLAVPRNAAEVRAAVGQKMW